QLPVIPLQSYSGEDCTYISGRAVRLVCTSLDLQSLADDLKIPAQKWDELERVQFRAELDAYYAHLYGLTRDELRYILDPKDVFGEDFPSETFRVLKEREEKELGEYRTQRLVLQAFDKLAESPRFQNEMSKRQSRLKTSTEQMESVAR